MRKQGIGKIFGIALAMVLLVGCGGHESKERTADAEDIAQEQDRLIESRIIQEQSFPVELNGWGEVTFVSYKPDDSQGANAWEDVSFYLLRDGRKEILSKHGFRMGPCRGGRLQSGLGKAGWGKAAKSLS